MSVVARSERPPTVPVWRKEDLGKTLTLRAHYDNLTGYGQLGVGLLRELIRRGIPCQAVSMAAKVWEPVQWGKHAAVGKDIHALLTKENREGWEVLMASPHHAGKEPCTVALTMWESNRLPEGAAEKLNRHQALIVPSEWAQLSFDAAGVRRPMYKANLPISDVFREYRPFPQHDPFTFGLACRRAHGGLRKGVEQACRCFLEAFPGEKDVRLRLKFYPDCTRDGVLNDPRIEVIQEAYTEAQMADFLASLHCYVSTSQAEGYGLVQAQAMGVGRPVIGVVAHAQAEYLKPGDSFAVDYDLRRAEDVNPLNAFYQGYVWAPKDDSVIDQMRWARRNPELCMVYGKNGHERAATMTWDKFGDEFLAALRAEGLPV